jgi:hypothetical protein
MIILPHVHGTGGTGDLIGIAGLLAGVASVMLEAAGLLLKSRAKWRRERKMRKLEELFHVPQLKRVLENLDRAIELRNRRLIRQHLDGWRELASKVQGILPNVTADDRVVRRCLKKSISLARGASTALLEGDQQAMRGCLGAREAITAAFDGLTGWVAARACQG